MMTRKPFDSWGWRIAWSLGVTQTVGYGVLFYTFGVLIVPMENELGWTRTQTSGAFSLALLLSGLCAIPVGAVVDRWGARLLMTAGSATAALLVLAWSFVESLEALYLVQAGIGLAMAAVLYEVAFTVIANWFRRERIQAMLVVTVLAGLASTIFIPFATFLVASLGWRGALRVLALVLALVTVPLHAVVLRHRPETLGLQPDGETASVEGIEPEPSASPRAALGTSRFWWLSFAFTLDRMAIVAVAAHVIALLVERGHSPAAAASVAGSIGLMQVCGRILFAPAASHASLTHLAAVTYAVRAASLIALLAVPGWPGMAVFAALFGLSNGASTLARAGLVAESFGAAHYGSISGAMTTLAALAQTLAPVAVGALRDASDGYSAAVWVLAALATGSALAVTRGRAPVVLAPHADGARSAPTARGSRR